MADPPVLKRHDAFRILHRWHPLLLEAEDLLSFVLTFESSGLTPKTRDQMNKLRKALKEEMDKA